MEARAHLRDGPLARELEEMRAPSSSLDKLHWKWTGELS